MLERRVLSEHQYQHGREGDGAGNSPVFPATFACRLKSKSSKKQTAYKAEKRKHHEPRQDRRDRIALSARPGILALFGAGEKLDYCTAGKICQHRKHRSKHKNHQNRVDHPSTLTRAALSGKLSLHRENGGAGFGDLSVSRRSEAAPMCAAFPMLGRNGNPSGLPVPRGRFANPLSARAPFWRGAFGSYSNSRRSA